VVITLITTVVELSTVVITLITTVLAAATVVIRSFVTSNSVLAVTKR